MNIKELIRKLEFSDLFMNFKRENPDVYLAHMFTMFENDANTGWQVGYYDKKMDKIIVFDITDINTGAIKQHPEEDVFKEQKFVKALDMEKLNIDFDKAMEIAENTIHQKYKGELPTRKIIVLQNIEFGNIWNITFITLTFNVINVKINAETGDVFKDSRESLLKWGKQYPGERKN